MPTRPSMRRPPAGSTNNSRSVSDFKRHRPHGADQAKRDVHDVAARRQHDVRRRAALLAHQLEGAGVVGLVGEHPPHQPAVDDRQVLAVARRQRQHRLSGGRGARRRHRRRHGSDRRLHDGGCVNGAGRSGSPPDRRAAQDSWPDRDGASGTAAGGTGGGRSPNICAEPGLAAATPAAQRKRQQPGTAARPARDPPIPLPREVMAPAFHRKRGKFKPRPASRPGGCELAGTPKVDPAVIRRRVQSHSLPRSLSPGINHACG